MMTMFDPHAERPWSTEEDKQLRDAVLQEKEQNRPVKWDTIAVSLPRRSKKECRKRWHQTMMEAVRKCQWKPEEDERLSSGVQKYGKHTWTSVSHVVMTRDENECMRRWDELQNQKIESNPNSPTDNQWASEDFNQIPSPHGSSGSSSSSSSFYHNSTTYSSPYGSLSDPMVDEFLREAGHMRPHNTNYGSMDIDPSHSYSADPPTMANSLDTSTPQDNLDTFIDFNAERSGRMFEIQHAAATNGQPFDPDDWSWFDNMVTPLNGDAQDGYYNQHHIGGFLTDSHPNELFPDSPGALGSGTSSCSSGRSSPIPIPMQPMSGVENFEFYNLQNIDLLQLKGNPGGARVVIVCNSNDSRTLNSLNTIMKTLKANGHAVIQETQPVNDISSGEDYLGGSLDIDDVLQDLY